MQFLKFIAVLSTCLFIIELAAAQRSNSGKSQYTRSHYNYRAPIVRGAKAKTICPIFASSKYPYHGIGFKLGDPFALTYKYYPSKRVSVAVDFGKASSGLYNRYFREKFDEYASKGNDTLSDNSSLSYSSHRVKSDLIGEFKVLYHIEASKISPGLQVYIGGGWEWKNTKLQYNYFYNRRTPSGGELINDFRTYDQQRFTMGPQVMMGIEYAYFQLPISAFMEVEYFTDVQADPGWHRFEGGVGLRYIF
jgi:hypothetical protein